MKRIRTLSLLLILCLFGFVNISGQIGIANYEKPNVSQIFPEVENYIMQEIPFEWIEISGANPLPASPENSYLHHLLFPFKFYDLYFTNVWISQYGYLSFSTPEGYPVNLDFPLISPWYSYMIAPFWDSLYPRTCVEFFPGIPICVGGGNYYVKNFPDFTIVEWKDIAYFSEMSYPVVGSFQVILKESGDIIFNYDYLDFIDPGNDYTCGLNYGKIPIAYNTYDMLDSGTEDFSLLFTQPDFIPATVDFDPDTLNRKSQGNWVTVYIELPEGFDVNEIDISTIRLIGKVNCEVPAEDWPTEVIDGILMVKFDRAATIEAIVEGTDVDITITGKLLDGTPFEGFTEIRALF